MNVLWGINIVLNYFWILGEAWCIPDRKKFAKQVFLVQFSSIITYITNSNISTQCFVLVMSLIRIVVVLYCIVIFVWRIFY